MASTIVVPNRERVTNYGPELAQSLIDGLQAASTDIGSLQATPGAALTDAAATVQVGLGNWHTMPAATLTANRAITLGTTGAVEGSKLEFTRLDTTSNTLAFINGGTGAGTLYTMAASKLGCATFYFNGTNWVLRTFGVQ